MNALLVECRLTTRRIIMLLLTKETGTADGREGCEKDSGNMEDPGRSGDCSELRVQT
jgi:hypothetical protein